MNDCQQRESLFSVLKQVLKTRGFTYSSIAQALGVTELTVKRLFKDRDCKMSRLLEICEIAGLSLSDLVTMQERISSSAQYLPAAAEQALATSPRTFVFLLLLVSWVDLKRIGAECQLSEQQIYLLLRELEKIGIIELLSENKIKYLVNLPIRWRLDGPLGDQIKSAKMKYISHCIEHDSDPEYEYSAASRLMSETSVAQIQESMRQLKRDFDYLATQDQMFYPSKDLLLTKMVFAVGPFPILEIFPMDK